MEKKEEIISNKIKCKKCGDIIESKSTNDYKKCSCGAVAVDGGKDYLKMMGNEENYEEEQNMESRTIKLNNGIEIDRVGLGFWEVRGAEAEKTLASAVEAGYRRIDTAMYYHNEEDVGAGIRVCGIPRKELFVASKIWYTDMCGSTGAKRRPSIPPSL